MMRVHWVAIKSVGFILSPTVQAKDPKLFFAQSLGQLSQKHPGQIAPLIQPQGAAHALLTQLKGVLDAAGVSIV